MQTIKEQIQTLEIKHLAPYLPYGLKVQYKGIVNGKELSEYDKRYKEATKDDMFVEFNEDKPSEIIALKVGMIKSIEPCLKFTKYRIGGRGKQTHYGTEKFKLILHPLSGLTNINSPLMNSINSDIPIQCEICDLANSMIGYWQCSYDTIEVMAEHHIDFFNLIPAGLAIDINTLKK